MMVLDKSMITPIRLYIDLFEIYSKFPYLIQEPD
jgi:hypothetical protein